MSARLRRLLWEKKLTTFNPLYPDQRDLARSLSGGDEKKRKNAEAQISRYLGKDNRRPLSPSFAKMLLDTVTLDLQTREPDEERRDLFLDEFREELQGMPPQMAQARPRFERVTTALESAKEIFIVGIESAVASNNAMGRELTQIMRRQLGLYSGEARRNAEVRYTFCFPKDPAAKYSTQLAREFWSALFHEICSEGEDIVAEEDAHDCLLRVNHAGRLRVFCCDPKLVLFPSTFVDPTKSSVQGFHIYFMPNEVAEVCPISRAYAIQARRLLLDPLAVARVEPSAEFEEVTWEEVYRMIHLFQA